jgi:hypothetical protein
MGTQHTRREGDKWHGRSGQVDIVYVCVEVGSTRTGTESGKLAARLLGRNLQMASRPGNGSGAGALALLVSASTVVQKAAAVAIARRTSASVPSILLERAAKSFLPLSRKASSL